MYDVKRAYFHAPAKRKVFVDLPPEGAKEGLCGELVKSMHVTRYAAKNWEEAVRQFMQGEGFVPGKSNPCFYWHEGGVRGETHGDYFVMGGQRRAADRFKEALCAKFEVKHKARLGPKPKDDKRVRILNRVISWTPQVSS